MFGHKIYISFYIQLFLVWPVLLHKFIVIYKKKVGMVKIASQLIEAESGLWFSTELKAQTEMKIGLLKACTCQK